MQPRNRRAGGAGRPRAAAIRYVFSRGESGCSDGESSPSQQRRLHRRCGRSAGLVRQPHSFLTGEFHRFGVGAAVKKRFGTPLVTGPEARIGRFCSSTTLRAWSRIYSRHHFRIPGLRWRPRLMAFGLLSTREILAPGRHVHDVGSSRRPDKARISEGRGTCRSRADQ